MDKNKKMRKWANRQMSILVNGQMNKWTNDRMYKYLNGQMLG